MNKDIRTIPENELKLYYNEYMRRWKIKNKDLNNMYRREAYKRYKKALTNKQ